MYTKSGKYSFIIFSKNYLKGTITLTNPETKKDQVMAIKTYTLFYLN